MQIPDESRVEIKSPGHWANGEWGIVKLFDGNEYHVAINGGSEQLVFGAPELRRAPDCKHSQIDARGLCLACGSRAAITLDIEMLPGKPVGSGPIVEHEYDVTVRRGGFASYDVTAHSENAKKLLGVGTLTYEQRGWVKLNKDLKHYGYTIEVK